MRDGLVSTKQIGQLLRAELDQESPNPDFMARTVTNEIWRWNKLEVTDSELIDLCDVPPLSGDARWDAFVEGLVAREFNVRGLLRPDWTNVTRLNEAWAPYEDTVTDAGWHVLSVLHTPVELLDRGVVFDVANLVRR